MKLLTITYGGVSYLTFIVLALAIPIVCCLFDKIRILIMKPIWTIFGKIDPKLNSVQKKFMDIVKPTLVIASIPPKQKYRICKNKHLNGHNSNL